MFFKKRGQKLHDISSFGARFVSKTENHPQFSLHGYSSQRPTVEKDLQHLLTRAFGLQRNMT